jgi:diguanylate cyclase (GGDEF)-like protein
MDLHTLHVEHTFLLAVYTLLTVVNARMHRGISGIHWFSIYNALLFLGALLVAMRGHIPDWLSIVGGNVFVMAGYVTLFFSLARFFGSKSRQIYIQLGLTAIGVAAMIEYGAIHPDTDKRLLAYSIILCLQQAHVAGFTVRQERRDTQAAASMAVMLGALAVMNLWRIATVALHGVPQDYLKVQGGLVWLVLINTSLQCGAIVSYVWMTASLLRGHLAVQASTDPLTGLLNRRAMDRAAELVLADTGAGQTASAIAIDLNDFKQINDTFGHSCGDAALVAVARCLEVGLRHSDAIGRMGGDEFIALLPRTSIQTAREIARALDRELRSIVISHGNVPVRVSASFGCAQAQGPNGSWSDLVVACDKALYESKNERRRRKTASAEVEETAVKLLA